MNAFDYGVLAILLVSIVVSVLRGLVREILSLIGWVAAFVVASLFAESFASVLTFLPAHPVLRTIVAFLVLLLGMALTMAVVNWGIMRAIRAAGLTLADRGLGGLFGLARGVVIVLALVMVAGMTKLPQMSFWKEAMLSPLAETAVRTLRPMLPAEIAGKINF
ncbi:MAG: CvpA family protein [Burkholderiales bacterium]|nr:CvpA family protein [Burkholderiales bacterium]